jgi:hypothetical protein
VQGQLRIRLVSNVVSFFGVHCLPVQSERREGFKRKEFEPGTSPPQTDTDNYAQFNDLPGRNGVQALGIASTQQKQQTGK